MDYLGHICPICQKRFHADDDVVVCPECGTPHHRECYRQLGHCANEERHQDGFDYTAEEHDAPNVKKCPSCGCENDENSFFCKKCGVSLSPSQQQNQPPKNEIPGGAGFPFGFGSAQQRTDNGDANNTVPFLDPLGGVPGDTDLGDGVNAGEAAKYVKQNTPYFIRIFSNIKTFNRSKFNFSAALLTSAYLLYRKMYKVGAALLTLQLALFAIVLYFTIVYRSVFENFTNTVMQNGQDYMTMVNSYAAYLSKLSGTDLLILYLPVITLLVYFVIKIVVGACFNRLYMKNCKQQIAQIKGAAAPGENPETLLQTKGGVNTALGASVFATALIIYYFTSILII